MLNYLFHMLYKIFVRELLECVKVTRLSRAPGFAQLFSIDILQRNLGVSLIERVFKMSDFFHISLKML